VSNLQDTINNKQNHKWLVKLLLGLFLVLCLMVSGAYLLRNILAKVVLEHFTQEQQLQVTCLDMDLDWYANVQLNVFCAELPNVKFKLDNALWLRNENKLIINRLHVQHVDRPSITTNKTETPRSLDFQLPANLPAINIEKFSLESPLLAKDLQLALSLNNADTLLVSGDVTASLKLKDRKWQAEVKWTLADVLNTLPAAQAFQQKNAQWLSNEVANSTIFVSRIEFDGQQLRVSNDINLDAVLAFPQCNIHLHMSGNIDAKLIQPLLTQNVNIDLSQLQSTFDFSSCEALPVQLADWQLNRFTIRVPKPIYLDFQLLKIPELQLSALNEQHKNANNLELRDISYDFKGALEAAYQVNIELSLHAFNVVLEQFSLNSSGKVKAMLPENAALTDLQWVLDDGLTQLSAKQVSNNEILLQQLALDFTLSGSDSSGIKLSGVAQANAFTGYDLVLGKVNSQVEMSIDAAKQVQLILDNKLQNLGYAAFIAVQAVNQIRLSAMLTGKPMEEGLDSLSSLKLNADTVLAKLHNADIHVLKLSNQLQVQGENFNALQFKSMTQLDNGQLEGVKLNKLTNQLDGKLLKLSEIDFSGQTNISELLLDKMGHKVKLKPIKVVHQGRSGPNLASSFSEHKITLEKEFSANLTQQSDQLSLRIEQQNITGLQSLITQFAPELTVTQGKFNASMNTNLNQLTSEVTFAADLALNEFSGRYGDYLFSGGAIHSPLSLNSAGLQLGETTLFLNSLNLGLPIEQIKASLSSVEGAFQLTSIVGNTLGGQFRVKNIWLDGREQHFDMVLENIDLAQVAALQDQPGISITGQIGGELPVSSSSQTVGIEGGQVKSNGGGILTISGNPAFDSIKKQQGQLAFLENYHFSQLSSKVTLKPDGWLLLDLAFYGQNPNKKQAVNFNYTHQENLFTLMETLRVTNSIQDKIEHSISKGGQQ
jgi:hypothetical protein